MPEYPIPHLAEKFLNLFQGNMEVYGLSKLTGVVSSKGKYETKNRVEHSPTTKEIWEQHLKGEIAIGQFPVRRDGTVRWAAFDIDIYKDNLNIIELLAQVDLYNLPVLLCRSKSGGAHGYIFFREDAKIETVRPKIQEIATFFGVGGCEIFPKQDSIGTGNENVRYGNYLNMPYDGEGSLRYGYTPQAQKLSASEFVDKGEATATTEAEFLALALPRPPETLEDGPPCLNYLTEHRMNMKEGRNSLLFNLVTYLKKRNPDATPEEVAQFTYEWNAKFQEPLEEKEIKATILKSTKNKEYLYQCGNPLLKQRCNSDICKNCLYGIDGDENAIDPNNKSLIQLMTDPCLYFFDYQKTQLVLTKEEFWSYEKFRQACMVQARHIPPTMKQEHWLNLVQGYLGSVTIVELPPEATAVGQLVDILSKWKKIAQISREGLVNGLPVVDKRGALVFRLADLREHLRMHQFRALEDNRLIETLKNKLGMVNKSIRVNNNVISCWTIFPENLHKEPDILLNEQPEDDDNF